jgi:hypothetical protein
MNNKIKNKKELITPEKEDKKKIVIEAPKMSKMFKI